jgi:uncharacterized protein YndB with AHSA1/START domain
MRMLKKILLGLGILLAIPFIGALFIAKDYQVEREVVINKPIAEVFAYVSSLELQSNWSTWVLQDPNIKMTYVGEQGTIGSKAQWKSEIVGNGQLEITNISPGARIDTELKMDMPMTPPSPTYLTTEAVSETQTKVKWGMNGNMSYPMNFMRVFMDMEEMIGTEYAKSLQNLKVIMEK